ncbi:SRPBCC family protein [Micromonospora sp. WMMD812]|uniref:SRPBCC family protein n=1 Tax=Micromonospora sp. WMMD812 TaxID=3015152 RepID=UPI00248BFE7D|nr:SRPBCC family protein [Micromonospora sp. WMMD812]WBB68287.1 SRPBCC family protein [Micromonospora sp. WMMD812]
MKITNEFAVNTPIERAWAVLTDLEGIAPCLPGAQLTGVDGDVYRGRVRVKVGPVLSEFAGTAQFVEKDAARYRGVIDAKGRDARSAGNAAALVTAALRPDGDRTLVSVDTDLRISGRLAQFGSGMIKEVSGKLLAQFVANLEAKLAAEETETSAPAGTSGTSAARPEPDAAATAAPGAAATTTTPGAAATTTTPGAEGSANAAGAAVPATAAVGSAPTRPSTTTRVEPAAEPEALDLLSVAGGSITKRVVPVLVGLLAVGAVIAWLATRG